MIFGHEARLRNLAIPLRMGFFSACVLGISVLAVGFLSGCKNFWAAPAGSTEIALTNGGNITVAAGATGTSVITVTPANSWTGTVTLSCAVTDSITNDASPATCSLSPTSVSISGSTAATSTLTATTVAATTAGAYQVTVTGTTTDGTSATTSVCVAVGSGTCTSSAGTSGVFYVLNQTTSQIAALTVSSSGLTTVGTTSVSAGASAIAVAPNGNFLYVSTGSGLFLYTIASNGTLTLSNSQPIQVSAAAMQIDMQIDSTSSWLVYFVSGFAQINAISLDSSTGVASGSAQSFPLSSTTPVQLAISPNDSSSCTSCYVFVAMDLGGTEVIHFNPANANPFTSSVGAINPISSQGGANAVAVDPQNRLLYVGETTAVSGTQTGGLRVFTIAASGITSVSTPYASGGTGPSSILPTADGNYVYVANQAVSSSADGNITGFSVTTSALSTIGTTTAGPTGRLMLAEDSTHSYLLAVDFAGKPDLQAYTMSSGALTSAVTDPTGTDPVGAVAIAALP